MHGRALGRGLLDLERDAPPRAPVAAAPDRAVDAPAQLVLDLVALVVDVAERHGVVAARRVVLGGLGLLVARRWRRRRRRRGRRRGRRGRRRGERRRLRGLVLLERAAAAADDLDRRPRVGPWFAAIGFCVVPSSPKASPVRGGGDAGRTRPPPRGRGSGTAAAAPRARGSRAARRPPGPRPFLACDGRATALNAGRGSASRFALARVPGLASSSPHA